MHFFNVNSIRRRGDDIFAAFDFDEADIDMIISIARYILAALLALFL